MPMKLGKNNKLQGSCKLNKSKAHSGLRDYFVSTTQMEETLLNPWGIQQRPQKKSSLQGYSVSL